VSLSFRPRSVSHVQITTDLGGPGPLEFRLVLALHTGPHMFGGVILEAPQTGRVFSSTAY